ncbi:hypothetical protein GCM10010104_26340 [Streptomyces indiaensis]|uniref:Uncharacterized protein n=1 Tax=Streptomyces indiaensis TaxID=284033 RepID=A0ABN3DHM0_9ACTN
MTSSALHGKWDERKAWLPVGHPVRVTPQSLEETSLEPFGLAWGPGGNKPPGGLHLQCGVGAKQRENKDHRGESVTDTSTGRGVVLPSSVMSTAPAGDHR